MPMAGVKNPRHDTPRPGVRPASPRQLAAAAVVACGFLVIVISSASILLAA